MAYSVAGRTREIGVRMALGAQRSDVLWIVMRETLTLLAAGLAVGILLAIASSRGLSSLLFGLSAADPVALGATVAVLALVAVLAGWVPARRATRVDPMVALRYE
jgi:ABC-type antimicrobial peptide transport system permease subunit